MDHVTILRYFIDAPSREKFDALVTKDVEPFLQLSLPEIFTDSEQLKRATRLLDLWAKRPAAVRRREAKKEKNTPPTTTTPYSKLTTTEKIEHVHAHLKETLSRYPGEAAEVARFLRERFPRLAVRELGEGLTYGLIGIESEIRSEVLGRLAKDFDANV